MSRHGHDIYDDTGRRSHRPERAVSRRDERDYRDPMWGMMDRLDRDFAGFHNSMFSSMMGAMQGAFNSIANAAPDGSSTYYYESHTRHVGPDGRVHEETVSTRPGPDGRPSTQRIVRNPDGTHEETRTHEGFPPDAFPMFDNFRADFDWPFGMLDARRDMRRLPPAQVEEIVDDDRDSYRDPRRRRRRSDRREQPIVEEPDEYEPREDQQGRRSFFDRARGWRRG